MSVALRTGGAGGGGAIGRVLALLACLSPATARADAALTVTADQPLRFGSLVVPASGSRTIDPGGAVTGSGLVALAGDAVGPAQFTVTYDRGADSTRPITIVVQVLLAGGATQVQGGVTGVLSNFRTDLPGTPTLLPGQPMMLVIANCTERRCSRSFRVGARVDITRSSGGARLTLPVPVSATLLAAQ
ncbi:MAG: DUF4402 domain-containing protein [Sphingomonadales bacterium]|nr:DUF4402 domain-containing protein [Sphingomonadales bacterium]